MMMIIIVIIIIIIIVIVIFKSSNQTLLKNKTRMLHVYGKKKRSLKVNIIINMMIIITEIVLKNENFSLQAILYYVHYI